MMQTLRLPLLLSALLLAAGCQSEPEPAPPIDADAQAEIEREDARVFEEESQQP